MTFLYREEVLGILTKRGIAHRRVCGLATRGVQLPASLPVDDSAVMAANVVSRLRGVLSGF